MHFRCFLTQSSLNFTLNACAKLSWMIRRRLVLQQLWLFLLPCTSAAFIDGHLLYRTLIHTCNLSPTMCCSGMGNGSQIFSGHTNAGNRSSHYWWIISWSILTLRSNTHTQVLQELPLDYHQSLFLSRPSFGQSLSNCCMRSAGCRIFHSMISVCYFLLCFEWQVLILHYRCIWWRFHRPTLWSRWADQEHARWYFQLFGYQIDCMLSGLTYPSLVSQNLVRSHWMNNLWSLLSLLTFNTLVMIHHQRRKIASFESWCVVLGLVRHLGRTWSSCWIVRVSENHFYSLFI